jgi:hypothetical protein
MTVENVPDPRILNPRDAIVRITSTCICGSDLHLYNGFIPTMEQKTCCWGKALLPRLRAGSTSKAADKHVRPTRASPWAVPLAPVGSAR